MELDLPYRPSLDVPFLQGLVEFFFGNRYSSEPKETKGNTCVPPSGIVAIFDLDAKDETRILYWKGFGTYHAPTLNVPSTGTLQVKTPTLETCFRIASCTKSFTAAAILLLRARGLVNLDQPITDFIREFRFVKTGSSVDAECDGSAPTLRQLLSMSAGLSTDDPWADRQESLTEDEFLDIIRAGTPLNHVPGDSYEYSNLSFALLGRVVGLVSGKSYLDFVKQDLWEPLGLRNTHWSIETVKNFAVGFRRRPNGTLVELPISSPGAFSPIGGIITCAADLAKWVSWLAKPFTNAEDRAFGPLSAADRREMQQIHASIPVLVERRHFCQENGYGYGLHVEKSAIFGRTIYHSGGYPGFGAHMRWNIPGGFGVVVMENLTYADAYVVVPRLVDRILFELNGVALQDLPLHKGEAVPPIPTDPNRYQEFAARQLMKQATDPTLRHTTFPTNWTALSTLATHADALLDAIANKDLQKAHKIASEIFSPCVLLDLPLQELMDKWSAVLVSSSPAADADPSDKSQPSPPFLQRTPSPARVWWLRASSSPTVMLRVTILGTPTSPTLIQALVIDSLNNHR